MGGQVFCNIIKYVEITWAAENGDLALECLLWRNFQSLSAQKSQENPIKPSQIRALKHFKDCRSVAIQNKYTPKSLSDFL